jgi:hypothetical protein
MWLRIQDLPFARITERFVAAAGPDKVQTWLAATIDPGTLRANTDELHATEFEQGIR